MRLSRHALLAALAVMAAPATLRAQVQGPSARALGMAGAYSLQARGHEAPTWNPAILALPGRPKVSIGLPQSMVEMGSNAYGLGEVLRYANVRLSEADKAVLLARIDTTLRVRMVAELNPVGISIGRFALNLASSGEAEVSLGKDAVDLALHGNAARSGPGEFFTAEHSGASGWAVTTLSASTAFPIEVALGHLALGVTVKRVWGRALARADELSSRFAVSPTFEASGAGHAMYTTFPAGYQLRGMGLVFSADAPGNGFGVDLGGALQLHSGLTVGVVLVNALGDIAWRRDRLKYERTEPTVTQGADGVIRDTTRHTVLVGSAIDTDPVALAMRDSLLRRSDLARMARAGLSYQVGALLLSGDVMVRITQGLDRQPAQSVSAGIEYVLWGFLPLRSGFGADFAGAYTLTAGTGLYVGPVRLDVGAASIHGPLHHGLRVGAGLSLAFGS